MVSMSRASIGIPKFSKSVESGPPSLTPMPPRVTPCDHLSASGLVQSRAGPHISAKSERRKAAMKIPGPDHPIAVAPNPRRVRVSVSGAVIADTVCALTLKEASYPAVQYIPRADARMDLLARTERTTHCPYKGDASYFSVTTDGK